MDDFWHLDQRIRKMKIVYLITGSGGSFYCGNCYRDMLFLRAIRRVPGISASAIPLYLPPDKSNTETGFDDHVFFGAISMYLREKAPLLRNMPAFLDKILDFTPFLKLAAKQAGTTRTDGLEELTLNMIEGDNAFKPAEVKRLVKYLESTGKPDIVHLSNALILGLARQLKKHMNIKIVCSLLNEDDWIDEMKEPFKSRAWELIGREAVYVDRFVTPSSYYKELFIAKTGVNGDNIDIVPLGFDSEGFHAETIENRAPAIGYFCRVNSHNGFDKIVDAFIKMKKQNTIPGLTLNVCGGYTGDDKPFISAQIKKIREQGYNKSVKIYPEFQGNKKAEFFKSVDVISVPVRKYDGYGMYILEANLEGVPVVQPSTGAFPEIIETTGGGITYSPDNADTLAEALTKMMTDSTLREEKGKNGYAGVRSKLSLAKMSDGLAALYNSAMQGVQKL
jgi:glycosyltransferase involved in cell wall biosynthesis